MEYRIRDGLVLDTVCGEPLLVATRKARPYCPYVTIMNKDSVFVWQMLEKRMTLREMLKQTAEEYDIPDAGAEEVLLPFLKGMLQKGYIVEYEG